MANRLAQQTSPYLLQHQHNPVDWYPWGPEALETAARLDRPILLSIGYSACHWCHVMERESFEDPATAAHMNAHFVNVKVDREERPDLDELYMRALQAFTGGHGGWPMTVFLTPQGSPFFCGTYFPPTPRQGMPSFRQVMDHARRLYHDGKADLAEVTSEMRRYLDASGRLPGPAPEVGNDWLERVARAAAAEHDPARGGFGQAPKFPPHGTLAVLLAHHHRTGDRQSLAMATGTLDAMARGGMYDQLGGGFARYSVDDAWRVPHFEKMLYDNAQLLAVYTDAWVLTGKPLYERVVRETVDFLLRELRDPRGGFWSALDADSEGVEGRYYAWTPAQVATALQDTPVADRAAQVCALLGVTEEGTFEHGSSVLRLERPLDTLPGDQQALLRQALPALARARDLRTRPGTDDKVITAWNALAISALARAAAAFDEEPWFEAAATAAAFLLEQVTVDGRLMRTWKASADGGRAHLPAYADDHAFLVQALVDLYQANFDESWLRDANRLCDRMLALFWDDDAGGLFYTGHDAEPLVSRSKHMMGGAEPAANGVAALAMLRLAALSDRPELRDRAELVVRCYRPLLEQAPRALGAEALAAAWLAGPSLEIGLVGPFHRQDTVALLDVVRRRFLPFSVVAVVEPGAGPEVLDLLPWMHGRTAARDRATAFVCQGSACLVPTQEPADLAEQLEDAASPSPTRQAQPLREAAPPLPQEPERWLNSPLPLSLEQLRGRVVVLDFWSSCCINCQHVLPELAAVEARLAGQPFAVIGVHSGKFPAEREASTVRRAIRRLRIPHPVIHDPDHALWKAFGVQAWPTVIVLDALGRIAWRHAGEVRREELLAVVDGLLDEARQAGLPAPARLPATTTTLEDSLLDHPGKMHLYPDAAAQEMGADPFGPQARLYVADTGHHRVVECRVERGPDGWPAAHVERVFGSGTGGLLDARAPLARFQDPQGLARAGDSLWVADTGNHALRRIDLSTGQVSTVAGTGRLAAGPAQAQRRPLQTELRSPWDVAVAGADAGMPGAPQGPDVVFVAMAGMHQVWVYLAEHDELGPFLGSGREDHVDGAPQEAALAQPSGLCLFGRYIFLVDSETSSVRAFDLAEREVGTVVGRGLFDFGDVDGPPDQVRLQHPLGLTLADGELYVADTFNGKIKVISLQGGHTRTLCGAEGELCEPGGVAVAGEFLLVADTGNHELKVVHRRTGELRRLPLR